MAELILGPLIGGLAHNRANLWARADGPAFLHAWLATKGDLSDAKLTGKTALEEATGFAGIITLEKLKAETSYYFALTLDPRKKPEKGAFRAFKTFPRPGQPRSFRFAFSSCFRPGRENAGQAFQHILDNQHDLSFLLMLGDQIYADEWKYNGLGRVASTRADYRQVYRNTWSNPALRELLARTPVFMILDDHEVDNDWHWQDRDRQQATLPLYTRLIRWISGRPRQERELTRQRVRDALRAYWEHQGMHAPPLLLPPEREKEGDFKLFEHDPGSLAYTLYYGAAAFFVMDTRTMRVRNRNTQVVLGKDQWRVLKEWLLDVKKAYPLKFLVTSSAFLFAMFGDIAKDRWSGFPKERDQLLHFLAENGIENVYFLAGDLHEAHAISAELYGPEGQAIPVWEFCCSPFEQETSWLVKALQHPLQSPAVRNPRVHFSIDRINYGIVEVRFGKDGKAQVDFTVHYKDRGRWETRSP